MVDLVSPGGGTHFGRSYEPLNVEPSSQGRATERSAAPRNSASPIFLPTLYPQEPDSRAHSGFVVVEGQEAAPGGMDAPPELHADQTDYIDYVWSSQRLIVVDEEVLDRPPWRMVVVEDLFYA